MLCTTSLEASYSLSIRSIVRDFQSELLKKRSWLSSFNSLSTCQLVHLAVPSGVPAVLEVSHRAVLLASHRNLVSFILGSSIRSYLSLTEILLLIQ